jgi:hypothetical protein
MRTHSGRGTATEVLRWTGALVAASLLLNTACSRSRNEHSDTNPDAAAVAGALWDSCQQQADAETLEAATAVLTEAVANDLGPLQTLKTLAEPEKKALAENVVRRLRDATGLLPASIESDQRFIAAEWKPAFETLVAARLEAARLADATERDARRAQQAALALGSEHKWFWLSAVVAVASLLAVFAVDRRQEIRRYFNGGRARGLGLGKALVAAFVLLCILTLGLFLVSDGLLVAMFDRGPTGRAVAAIADQYRTDSEAAQRLKSRIESGRTVLAEKQELARRAIARILPADTAAAVFDDWWKSIDATTRRRGQLSALDAAMRRFDDYAAAIGPGGKEMAAIEANRSAAARWRRSASFICGVIGVGLLALLGSGVGLFLRGLSKRTQKLAATCPLCLAEGKLQEGGVSPDDGDRTAAGMVRCKNVISETPFEECDFDFPAMFQSVPKLCFPTLGVPSAGKTHWLAMVYRELNLGNFPEEVEFARIRSESSSEFEAIVHDILSSKQGPSYTQDSRLPRPLVFNFIDRDRLGRSNILVNIFDYSGEVLRRMTLEDYQRQRAFTADGYFYFLDPSKGADEQTQPLANFRQDVRIVKKMRAGQHIRCPVALCVPKIDLLPTKSYADPAGGDAIDLFYRELGDIGWQMDIRSIAARSAMMRRLRDTIWPGWEIERQIDDLFGGRYMFFPFTPVGLDGRGEELPNREISPVGILHPLLWLIHMAGYPVLRSRQLV